MGFCLFVLMLELSGLYTSFWFINVFQIQKQCAVKFCLFIFKDSEADLLQQKRRWHTLEKPARAISSYRWKVLTTLVKNNLYHPSVW